MLSRRKRAGDDAGWLAQAVFSRLARDLCDQPKRVSTMLGFVSDGPMERDNERFGWA